MLAETALEASTSTTKDFGDIARSASYFVLFCLVYAIVEFVYLHFSGAVTRYKRNFADVQNTTVKNVRLRMWPYGVLSYVVLFVTVWYFVIADIVGSDDAVVNYSGIVTRATMLALAIYGVYNLTNAATLSGYGWDVVLMDVAWGVFAVNAVSAAMWLAVRAEHAAGRLWSTSTSTSASASASASTSPTS